VARPAASADEAELSARGMVLSSSQLTGTNVELVAARGHLAIKTALFAAVGGGYALAFRRYLYVQGASDLESHIGYARSIQSAADITSPHFLFQILLKLVVGATQVSYEAAATLVLGGCYAGMAVLLYGEMQRRGLIGKPWIACLQILALLVASHIFLPTLFVPNFYYGYFVPVTYHNGNQQPLKLLALAVVFAYSACFFRSERPRRPLHLAGIAALCILSALAKPSFLIAFVPATGFVAMIDAARRNWRRVANWIWAIALPSAAILLWQARFTYGGDGSAGIVFAPFAVFTDPVEVSWKLLASLAFPLTVFVTYGRRTMADPDLRFAAIYLIIGLVFTLLLAESGPRMQQGNFAWTGQLGVFLSYVGSFLFLIARQREQRAANLAWIVFGLHVVSGSIWMGANLLFEAPSFL
jgi:hypothetical protein